MPASSADRQPIRPRRGLADCRPVFEAAGAAAKGVKCVLLIPKCRTLWLGLFGLPLFVAGP